MVRMLIKRFSACSVSSSWRMKSSLSVIVTPFYLT
jgi:hypothetical protein